MSEEKQITDNKVSVETTKSVTTELVRVAESVKEAIPEIKESVKEAIPELTESVKEAIPELTESVKEAIPEIKIPLRIKLRRKERAEKKVPVFSGIELLPGGRASDHVTKGCIILEGGAFRGVFTSGVLDALMEADINFECTVGCSAGALNGMNYVSGQIGRSGRVNLRYRHDGRYVGGTAMRRNHGVIGFDFVFSGIEDDPFDSDRFMETERRFVAVATNCKTGEAVYFEKDSGDKIYKAVQASASMPYVSRMVDIDGEPYLDGGCSVKVPYQWAIDQGYEKIIVVLTRPADYRKTIKEDSRHAFTKRLYREYPEFVQKLIRVNEEANAEYDEIHKLAHDGRIFVLAPHGPVNIGRLEPDMEKLGALYYMGYDDTKERLEKLRGYLAG